MVASAGRTVFTIFSDRPTLNHPAPVAARVALKGLVFSPRLDAPDLFKRRCYSTLYSPRKRRKGDVLAGDPTWQVVGKLVTKPSIHHKILSLLYLDWHWHLGRQRVF